MRKRQINRVTSNSPKRGDLLPTLAPRYRRVLRRLLTGDSEKQIAAALGLSKHTVHEYVKRIYRAADVSSRAELLARWIE